MISVTGVSIALANVFLPYVNTHFSSSQTPFIQVYVMGTADTLAMAEALLWLEPPGVAIVLPVGVPLCNPATSYINSPE